LTVGIFFRISFEFNKVCEKDGDETGWNVETLLFCFYF
jgi:hypothetical protein